MSRLLIVLFVCAVVVGGGAAGWYALTPPPDCAPPPDEPPCAVCQAPHRFTLPESAAQGVLERPAVAVDGKGRLLLAWAVETGDAERTLFLARSADGGATFAEPSAFRKVGVVRTKSQSKGKEVTRSSHVQPRLASSGDAIFLSWCEPAAGGKAELRVARSTDGGQTFAEPVQAQGGAVRPAYTALAAGPDGALACAWLDRGQKPYCATATPAGPFAAELQAYARPNGKGVCPCCDTDVLRGPDGTTYVAFRDNDADVRDIQVCRLPAGATAFEPPVPTSDHRWKFPGCPHDGPVLALTTNKLHVVWMDGSGGKQRVWYGRSGLDRMTFTSQPLDVQAPGTQGHPRIAAGAGRLHAVWDGSLGDEPAKDKDEAHHHHAAPTGEGRAVMFARWPESADGPAAARAPAPQPGVFQLSPAVAVGPAGDAFVVWSELTEKGKAVAFLRFPAEAK